jgi:hypothetical protein
VRFLRKYIFANAGLKLLALAISFLIVGHLHLGAIRRGWLSSASSSPPCPPNWKFPATCPPRCVRVRGRSAFLRRMVPADLNLRMDMKDAKEGTATLSIRPEMVGAPFGATVVQVSPSEIHVTLVPRHDPAPPSG